MWHLPALIAALPTPPAESEPFSHYAPVGVLLLMALVFGAGNVILTQVIDRLTGIRRQGPVKSMTYESGMNPIGSAHQRFNVRFYIVAVTFLVFDVEIVFLYPWATVFPSLAPSSGLPVLFLSRMLFFVSTSVIAFAYAWRKGVFRYD
jgi:NADH-quinone oxidoreductase subunit A